MDFITEKWLREVVGDEDSIKIESLQSLNSKSGMMGDMFQLKTTHGDNKLVRYRVVKTLISDEKKSQSLLYGLWREAFVLNTFGKKLANLKLVPEVYYSSGNKDTGEKVVVMEDISEGHVSASVFFSKNSPHMSDSTDEDDDLSAMGEEIVTLIFKEVARFHAEFWNNQQILSYPWLRKVNMYAASAKDNVDEEWSKVSKSTCEAWIKGKTRTDMKWDAHLVTCMDVAMSKFDWNDACKQAQAYPFTLCHGDFHAGNILVNQNEKTVKFVDFEVCMINVGPAELGQFVISNVSTGQRRSLEKSLIQTYYAELKERLGDNCDLDESTCWDLYKRGGAARWTFFLSLFVGAWGAPAETCQYFHDQIADFLKDHFPNPEDIDQPML